MHRAITLLMVSGSLLGATALAACGSSQPAKQTTAAAPASSPAAKTSSAVAAQIKDMAFAPQDLKVKVGQTVTWKNNDEEAHTVTATSGATFDSGTVQPGSTFSWKATKAGTVQYMCTIHPSMVGTIAVG
jgi:plastocyanin